MKGCLRRCDSRDRLHSYEVNFKYVEKGEVRNELVKVRLCKKCGAKMTYKSDKEKRREAKRRKKHHKHHPHSDDHSSTSDQVRVYGSVQVCF
jgi:protein FRA10AC1